MTTHPRGTASNRTVPQIALRGADLDVVELSLTLGGLEVVLPEGGTMLTDLEGTPVAEVEGGVLRPGRALAARPELDGAASGAVPPTDPALRDADAVVVFDHLPTRTQVAAVSALDASGTVAWIALTGRSRRDPASGSLLGAVGAAARSWSARTGRAAPVAALPWALEAVPQVLGAPALGTTDGFVAWLTRSLGAAELVVFGEGAEHRALADLEDGAAGAARALYPAEVLPFHRGGRGGGTVVLLTGLSGSGKSTIANAVAARLTERGSITTVLDGDDVRRLLSSGLGFDAEGRATNVRRIGWVAAQVARAGAVAVAAPIAPFAAGRAEVRRMAEDAGVRFVLVHVSTSLEVCEARDRKGLYAAARAGAVGDFTGVSSPYQAPTDADVVVDTAEIDVDEAVARVLAALDRDAA